MRKLVLLASMLCCFSSIGAITARDPIEGFPSIISKEWITGSGNTEFTVRCPNGWGIGDTAVSDDGTGHFLLFPIQGGPGCTIDAEFFEDETLLKGRLKAIQKSLGATRKVKEGSELYFINGWYLCRKQGQHLVQIWFTKPQIERQDLALWEAFKECLTISNRESPTPVKKGYVRLTEDPAVGWWCHHPLQPLDVLFETFPTTTVIPNGGGAKSHLLEFNEVKSSGYFFIKWNGGDALDHPKVYQDHLKQMVAEIKKIEPTQQAEGTVETNLDNRYALLNGSPYKFISLAGDGFLFGFAIKANNPYQKVDLNEYVNRVKWKFRR